MPPIHGLAAGQHGVITRAQAMCCGVRPAQIDRLVRSHRWRRLRSGVYLVDPSGAEPTLAARVVAVQLALGPLMVAAGPTAVRLWGLHGLPPGSGRERVHVAAPTGASSTPAGGSLHRHRWRPEPGEIALHQGIRLTTPGRTLRDIVLISDRHTAVSVIDSALQRGAVAAGDLPALILANGGRPGAARTRTWWSLADGRAQSSLESRLRVVCHDAGIPPETLQYPVCGADGTLVGRADLAWPSRGVIAEADGRAPHSLPDALYADRRRQNSMVSTPERLVLLRFTWRDLHHPKQIAATIRSACRVGER